MEETSEFDNAIELALNETDEDTLILVTSDHSHSFTLNGYAKRGNDILGRFQKIDGLKLHKLVYFRIWK